MSRGRSRAPLGAGDVGVVGAHVVAVGQRPSGLGSVFDGEDAGGGEFFEGPVDCVDRAVQPAGQQYPAGHPHPGGVAVAGQDRVEAEGGVGHGGVEHPLGDDGETLLEGELAGLVSSVQFCYNVASRFFGAFEEGEVVSHDAPSTAACGTGRAGGFVHRLRAAATQPPGRSRTGRTRGPGEPAGERTGAT